MPNSMTRFRYQDIFLLNIINAGALTKSGEGYILRNTNLHLIQVADFIDSPPVFIVAVGAVTTTDEELRSFKLTAGNYVTKGEYSV